MSFNGEEGTNGTSYNLINWIHNKMKQEILISTTQIHHINISIYIICQMLKEIDDQIFNKFRQHDSQKKIKVIQKYLQKQFGKKMKMELKKKLQGFQEQHSLNQLAKVVCYFGIHSNKKSTFINPILQLSQKNQILLMKQMDEIESELQTIVHGKQIIDQIQLLQNQNNELKQKLTQMTQSNSQLLGYLQQYQIQIKYLKSQLQKYRNQKCQTFSALNIDSLLDYMDAYRKIHLLNQKYLDDIQQIQQKIQKYQNNIKQLNQQINTDCLVINNMSEQITKLKAINTQNQIKYRCNSCIFPLKLTLPKTSKYQKQNIIQSPLHLRRQIQLPINQYLKYTQQQVQKQKLTIRFHNHDLMIKLQNMYYKYNKLNQQLSKQRQKSDSVMKQNNINKQLLKNIQLQEKLFYQKWNQSNYNTNI